MSFQLCCVEGVLALCGQENVTGMDLKAENGHYNNESKDTKTNTRVCLG